MLSLFVIFTSLCMEFLEPRTENFCCLSPTEGTEIVIILIDDDVWEAKDKQTCALNEKV